MRKTILKEICFVAFFLTFLCTLTYILRPDSDTKRRFAGFYAQEKNSLDVIYIGSSPVQPYWASALAWNEYGFTSWPLGTSVQQPRAAIFLIKEALKTQSPKVVIFELRMFTKGQDEFDRSSDKEGFIRLLTDNMKVSWNRDKLIDVLIPKFKERYSYYFDIIKYHTLWKGIGKINYEYWDCKREDEKGGHLVDADVVNLLAGKQDYSMIREKEPIPLEQEGVLRDLIAFCQKKGIQMLFTVNPYIATESEQRNFNYMSDIITNEYGYNFINFNDLYDKIEVDFAMDFYNVGHMNTHGAIKFTRYLADYLVKTYGLEDKRGGVGYSDEWDAMYESWKVEADKAIATIEQKVKEGNYDE